MARPVLYTYPLAYNPFKAALILEEKGVPYVSRTVDLFNGSSLTPDFLTTSKGKGWVPVLQDGERTITESREIVDYVNSSLGSPPGPLGGADADQALAARWVDKIAAWDGNLFLAANSDPGAAKLLGGLQAFKERYAEARAREHPELAATYQAKVASMKAAAAAAQDAAAVEANRVLLVGLLDEAEQQLAKTSFLAGGAYSSADVLFTPLLFRLGMAGKTGEYLKPRPHVSGYYDRMKQRPSFSKVFGPASSKLTLATLLLPALVKGQFAALTGRY